jgi:Zn-dependent protease
VSVFLLAWLGVGAWLLGAGAGAPGPAGAAAAFVAIVGSMLVHEGAHAVAAHRLGYDVQWVVLGGLAGVTAYLGRDDRPLERAAIALAGPAASAALVATLVVAGSVLPAGSIASVVHMLALFNALAIVGNLVPVGGTDGAHVVAGLAEHARSRRSVPAHATLPGEPNP